MRAVVERDGVSLSDDTDGGLGAARYEDGVRDGSLDLDHLARIAVIFNEPFVTLEFFPGRFLCTHAFRLGLLARDGRFAAERRALG